MRRVHVLAGVGTALLLAGCSGRPNDLVDNRYYQDSAATPSSSAAPVRQQQEPPSPVAAPATTTQRKKLELDRFALTSADLSEEGVQPTGTARTVLKKLSDCEVPLGAAKSALQSSWAYPTGSTVRHYVAEYDGDASQVVADIRDRLTCGKYRADNVEVKLSTPVADGNGQVSWCATSSRQSSCTVIGSAGPVLSVLVVTAATENKAKPAVTRIAPLAATALTRNS
ncbi:hypothetical protein JOF56_006047 [Kibdelosporangium banguiense]|uniref:Sensor domain-containing protein n=1 Tax=Kibdelosporangium banguiense TaxID=1365924 RepID=A0ABS4TMM9_9PSEU|nr:hypothetical protein [Kibdelosporangium banguiense]MBP2325662.1 hypothetical protein [Kibdelosporangium banguiense]